MTIQETIIEALKSVQAAHNGALATIMNLRSDKAALEAEVARLNTLVAGLKSRVAHLEAEAVKIVEPESVRSLLASLAQVVSEGQAPAALGTGGRYADLHGEPLGLDRPREEFQAPTQPVATRPNAFLIPRSEAARERPAESSKAADVA